MLQKRIVSYIIIHIVVFVAICLARVERVDITAMHVTWRVLISVIGLESLS